MSTPTDRPNTNETDWSEIAEPFADIRESRHVTVFPFVLEEIRRVGPKSILDFGGGDGTFARQLAEEIDADLVVYDAAEEMVKLARERLADCPKVTVVESTADFPDDHFDLVVMNAVWMCLETEEICHEVLGEIRRLTAPGGQLIASVTHPCFRNQPFSSIETDFDQNDYLTNGTPFQVFLGDRRLEFTDTHWNLTAMSQQLHASGWSIERIEERGDHIMAPRELAGSPWLIWFCR
jgi:SAM-dependent methyltransferase